MWTVDCGRRVPQLEAEGHKCTSIQGDMEKDARDRVIQEFRTGTTKILIATDVLARGFDVTQVQCSAASLLAHSVCMAGGNCHSCTAGMAV